MPNQQYRAFLAIPIPPSIVKKFDEHIIHLKNLSQLKHVKWIPPQNLHITLKFLGNISNEQQLHIIEQVQTNAIKMHPFDIAFSSIQPFPDHLSPKVIAATPHPITSVVALSLMIEKIVIQYKVTAEKHAFSPHLSLGRFLSPKKIQKLNYPIPLIKFRVNEFKLFRSDTKPEGVVYTPLSTISLKGA